MLLQIPPGARTYELQNSIVWFDDSGILYSRPKSDVVVEQSREEILAEMVKFKEITGGRKVCLLAESQKNSKPPKKSERDFIANELNSVVKAMAIVTDSALSKMVVNLFFSFKPPPYPVKLFMNEHDAREWIRQYL